MRTDIGVRGVTADGPRDVGDFAELYGDEIRWRQTGRVAVAGVRRDSSTAVSLPGDEDDVIEVEHVDGLVTFHRAGRLAEQARERTRGQVTGGAVDVTDFLDGAARGGGGQVAEVRRFEADRLPVADDVRRLDTVVGSAQTRDGLLDGGMIASRLPSFLLDPAARATAKRIVEWVDAAVENGAPEAERRRKPKQRGLYRVDQHLHLEPAGLLDVAPPSSEEPFLVFLHGTFSHTEAAFGQLRGSTEWLSMCERYGDRILAVEHATLGLTPAENANLIAHLLPEGARLHLVSHSRGGLVGEALSYASAHDPVLREYSAVPLHPDHRALPELRRTLVERGVTVERFARVACPARGTTLASRRLDTWASVLFNVFNLVPFLRETGVAAVVKKFVLAVLDQRADPRVIPGLEAQMPESPFLRMLLTAPGLDDGLGSITGDVEGSGIAKRLLVFGADLFYGEDHDFVVPTSSMAGGAPRPNGRRAFFTGSRVNHSSYFENTDSRQALENWLKASGTAVTGFEVSAPPEESGHRGVEERIDAEVLLVPDMFGTALVLDDGEPGWPDVAQLSRRGPLEALAEGSAGDLVGAYDRLRARLARRYATVTPWPYDPRRPVAELAESLRRRLHRAPAPVVVAHGAGTLLVLAALRDILDEWRRAGGRAVLLGPPLDGTWAVVARAAGHDELAGALALLDPSASPQKIGAALQVWPLAQLLHPDDGRQQRSELLPGSWSGITAIYGSAQATVSGRDADQEFCTSPAGDGFSLHPTGRGDAPESWYALTPHADLPGEPDVATAVLQLLAARAPARLSRRPLSRSGPSGLVPDPRGKLLLPTTDGLVRAAWGGGRRSTQPVLRVSVVHGDLQAEPGAVLVGHQNGTPIRGAESALNSHLRGALERRLHLGHYPGPLGTHQVFTGPGGPTAVVIGLGEAGDANPAVLTAEIAKAVLLLAAVYAERAAPDTPLEPITLSSVLIGTAQIPPMPVENAVTAIVNGVQQANRRLVDLAKVMHGLRIEELRIVELYEERAIEATRAAGQLAATLDGPDQVAVTPIVLDGFGGRSGLPHPDYQAGVWRTIRVVGGGNGDRRPHGRLTELTFTSIGRSARADQRVSLGQRALIEALVAEAISNPSPDEQLYNTLYELIVPNALKGQGYGGENLMLVVDEASADLPLEMLAVHDDRGLRGTQPIATEVGVVRRLEMRQATEATRPASGRAALVIGDPPTGGLPRLPGARREAELVRDLLTAANYEVTAIIPAPEASADFAHVATILNALFAREYRIVHIAGHGHYDPDPTRSGVVIGKDTVLGALEIEKMRTAPDLVFLNCCHLGAMGRRSGPRPEDAVEPPLRADKFASSVSRQLMANGVGAVVAAGWAVDDDAAARFAETFYAGLLGGDELGTAALDARQAVRRHHPSTNTWGAYQVYGAPAFRFDPAGSAQRRTPPPVGRRELGDALRRLRNRADDAPDTEIAAISEELADLLRSAPAEWIRGSEWALEGAVWGALARYDKAVAAYDKARADWSGGVQLNVLEQLANLRAKWAVQLAQQGAPDAEVTDQLDGAEKLIKQLRAIAPTPERCAVLGSLERRRALCLSLRTSPAPAMDITRSLRKAREAYAAAVKQSTDGGTEADLYHVINEAVLMFQVARRDPQQRFDRDSTRKQLQEARDNLEAWVDEDFWRRVRRADADLALALLSDTTADALAQVEQSYSTAFERSSRRNRVTILEHIDAIRLALPPGAEELADQLHALHGKLEQWRRG